MTTSALRRQVKNIVHNYSEAEIKVREATSNDPWGPPSSLMSEIADLTFNTVAFAEVMGMLWRRLNDSGKNWRHVYKALTLLDYLLKTGSERVAQQCRESLYTIQTLKDFQYVDRDGKDQGVNVREKVKQVMALLKDEERLRQERTHALKTKERMALEGTGISSGQLGLSRARGSPSSYNSSSSSPRYTSDLEQARPQTSGEEELQLQLALAMSREEAEKPVPPTSHRDEDLQLQLALHLSRQEQEKEVRSWQGDDSPVANGAGAGAHRRWDREPERGEREEEEKLKTSQSSSLDLVDIFASASTLPSTHCSADPWDIPGLRPNTEPSGSSWGPSADPWSPVPSGSIMSQSQPWDLPPVLSSSEPWGRTPVLPAGPPTTDFWAQNSPHHKLPNNGAKPWGNLVETFNTPALHDSSTFDPLAKPPVSTETKEGLECTQALPSGKPSSPVELDLFGDHTPSVKQNGTKEPDAFDLDVLGEALAQSSRDTPARRTPESFLGPSASSLVNLDSLVKVPQAVKTRNPFLTGLSTPSPTNPFGGGEQSRQTLNQMRTGSPALSLTAGGPIGAPFGSMTYSASLPLPLSSVPAGVTLPASVSVFPHARAFTPPPSGSLPQPLLPTSGSAGPLNQTPLTDTNPFL
ncbi:epsin-3 isoform X1 [Bubalus bubalis]|uniref:epsin-3 isoform X1 n=1 Tax=Bubalus bubalis TaxID=89462 RepID=UPI001E1B74CD|nr:epsin-3 isoform X1 [Bubalus bubalis]XP_025136121.2 epsin-3 isoform X1 [Bubalus bubalis]XP_025136122.2 epsin-3 isoform X1 [Bubalus bubalis]XP_025136123.2 epsin-3 isoform X1 [Bubalus bubalis]XP_025136125.2 epsin-3 isoform X1 [Bubalus bubalis]XP_044795034.2 epsin-3 isoform X1 [Bubalus bubalis]